MGVSQSRKKNYMRDTIPNEEIKIITFLSSTL